MTTFAATIHVTWALNIPNVVIYVCGRGVATNAFFVYFGGDNSTSPNPLDGFEGPLQGRERVK